MAQGRGHARAMTIIVDRILVPIDFSHHAEPVVEWAAHLAEEHNSELILLHAYHLPVEFQQLEGAYLVEKACQAFDGLVQHLIAFAKAKMHEIDDLALGVEGTDRDRRHTGLGGDHAAEGDIPLLEA